MVRKSCAEGMAVRKFAWQAVTLICTLWYIASMVQSSTFLVAVPKAHFIPSLACLANDLERAQKIVDFALLDPIRVSFSRARQCS